MVPALKTRPRALSLVVLLLSFSIDDFIGEIDKAARRAAEAAGNTGKLTPQKLKQAEEDGLIVDKGSKGKRSAATGMSLKAPKSKANSVIRPTNLDGFGETEQAGFGHVPSSATRSARNGETKAITARDISRAAAKDPAVLQQMRSALET